MILTDDAKTVIALTTRLGSSRRPSLSPGKWHRLAAALEDAGIRPEEVFRRPDGVAGVPGVPAEIAEAVQSLVTDAGSALLEAEELSRKGIWILTITDDEYPPALVTRLRANCPPVLFGVGEKAILARPGIGVVGSRDIGEGAAAVAGEVAEESVRLGRPVVSGGARGVDQLAMGAAHRSGGLVVGVLADSLLGRIRRPDTLAALDEGNTCLVSQQAPAAGFTSASAMARNKLIYALADVTVVVASSEGSGGTWSGAVEAIKAANGVVVVWRGAGEGPGNAALERMGAVALSDTGRLGDLLGRRPGPSTEQLSLY